LTTTAVAADAITTILNAYGLSADKAGNISDILFATVKRGKLTFEELAQSVGKVAATASIAGLSFEEVSAAIATMTRSGLNAFLATTALRSIMSGFLKPMESAKKAAAELGIELNSTTLRTIGLTGVLEKLKGASAEQLAALIPNRRALAGFSAMVKNASGQVYDLNLMLNSAGLTQIAYEKNTKTLRHSLNRLKQSFIILATSIGSTLAPAFDFLTKITIDSTKKAIDYLEKHKYEVMRWAAVVATRVNFVRGVIQDFLTGAVKNWPETWKFMKDVAVGQLDVIWKSFNLHIGTALSTAMSLFTAFGKSLYHIFEKVFLDVGANIVTWIRNGWQWHKARMFIEKEFADDEYARKFAEKDLRERGPAALGFDLEDPKGVGTWGVVTKKIKGEFAPALEKAKTKLTEMRDTIIEMEKKFAETIKVPGFLSKAIEERLKKMRDQEKDLIKQINYMERKEKWAWAMTGSGGGATGGPGGGTGAAAAAAGGGKVSFVGIREAWAALAGSLNKDRTQENILKTSQNMYKELQAQTNVMENWEPGGMAE
jgi:TP901 family phage tail tape measure protein